MGWLVAGGVLLLILVTLEMRRHRRRLKARRHDGSETDGEPEGGP
jgi:hypothetical protein